MLSSMDPVPASAQIDAIVAMHDDWRGAMLSLLRAVIHRAGPEVVEEVKWKKPSRPEGVPVWSSHGILCVADILKKSVRLTFPKGVQIKDPKGLFNARLDSKAVRAIDFYEGAKVDAAAVQAIIREAVQLNGG